MFLGDLRDVRYIVDRELRSGGAIIEVSFMFDEAILRIIVDPDDDTVHLFLDEAGTGEIVTTTRISSFDDLIPSLLSKSFLWVWELTNQQGYRDGIQFEFALREAGTRSTVTVQFIAIASSLEVYAVNKIV
jgi:hypothetical protein